MASDAELDRLKAAQDVAFQRKQDAYQSQQNAWERRSAARDDLNRAHERKQRAYEAQDSTWQEYQRIRSSNGPRIDQLNSQQETAFQNMKRAFENASAAHERRDGAGAKSYATQGHQYKAEAQGYVTERRRLVQEIRDARARHDATKPAFQNAKAEFSQAKRKHDNAKAEHERAQQDFKRAKSDFDRAVKAFQARLAVVRSQSKRRKDDKRALAEKAGVPAQYRDDVWVSTDKDSNTNIYFGGIGKPNGPGHGHYVLTRDGKVTYRRDPYDPHGKQNFERNKGLEDRLAQAALTAFHRERSSIGPRVIQYHDGEVTVKIRSGYNRRTNTIATDVIVIDRLNAPGEHLHLILSEHDGTILFSEWRKNH